MSNRREVLEQLGWAVREDPHNNAAWLNLGVALRDDSIRVDGVVLDRIYCFTKCLENDDYYWRAWNNLGLVLPDNGKVEVREQSYNRQACLVRSIELNDNEEAADAWLRLGTMLFRREPSTVSIQGQNVNAAACFARALEKDPHIAEAWHDLALVSPQGATVRGEHEPHRECIIRALELSPSFARAWYSLAVDLLKSRYEGPLPDTAVVGGTKVDEKTCLVRALECDPKFAHAWYQLSNAIREPPTTAIVGGEEVDSRRALQHAIASDERCALAWCNLAPALGNDGTLNVDGKTHNAQSASLRSIDIYRPNPYAWYNLGATLVNSDDQNATVTIDGTRLDAKECFLTALKFNPQYGRAWYSLGTCMGPTETVNVGGKSYSKYDCIAQGERFGGLWNKNNAQPTIQPEAAPTIPTDYRPAEVDVEPAPAVELAPVDVDPAPAVDVDPAPAVELAPVDVEPANTAPAPVTYAEEEEL